MNRALVRSGADHPYLDPVLWVPAREAVEAVHPVAGVEVVQGALAVDGKRLVVERDVHRPPPDVGLRVRMPDDALVLGRAAGLRPGVGNEGAVLGDARVLLVADGVLVEPARWKIMVNLPDRDPVCLEIELGGHAIPRCRKIDAVPPVPTLIVVADSDVVLTGRNWALLATAPTGVVWATVVHVREDGSRWGL